MDAAGCVAEHARRCAAAAGLVLQEEQHPTAASHPSENRRRRPQQQQPRRLPQPSVADSGLVACCPGRYPLRRACCLQQLRRRQHKPYCAVRPLCPSCSECRWRAALLQQRKPGQTSLLAPQRQQRGYHCKALTGLGAAWREKNLQSSSWAHHWRHVQGFGLLWWRRCCRRWRELMRSHLRLHHPLETARQRTGRRRCRGQALCTILPGGYAQGRDGWVSRLRWWCCCHCQRCWSCCYPEWQTW